MKKLVITFLAATTMLFSCNSSDDGNDTDNSDSVAIETNVPNENFLSVEKWDSLSGEEKNYYIISYAGVASEEEAVKKVDSLKPEFPKAGYLWIPDFVSLSGKELYAVFLDQSPYKFSIMSSLQKSKSDNKGIYVVRVNQSEERWEAYSPIDIRVNGEKQKMILTYATPEDEEEYGNEGGEDWGWFVNDVSSYFSDNYPEVVFGSVYGDDLLPEEIKSIEDQLDLEDSGFGYVLIDGKRQEFIAHDMPDYVISQACEFFGFASSEGD